VSETSDGVAIFRDDRGAFTLHCVRDATVTRVPFPYEEPAEPVPTADDGAEAAGGKKKRTTTKAKENDDA